MLSKTGLHALRAMAALARLPEGAYAGASAIAKNIGAPVNYLGKLLQGLSKTGLLVSQKGLGGGFRLARDASTISLFDVVEPIEHVSRWTGCFLGRALCSGESPCAVHERWAVVRDTYLGFLRQTRLTDFVPARDMGHLETPDQPGAVHLRQSNVESDYAANNHS